LIVFISIPWFLPAFKAGGPIQSIANLVDNCSEGIEYRVFCGDTDLNNEPLQNIITDKWVAYNNHTKVWYASGKNVSQAIKYQVQTIKPDVLFMIGIFSWDFNIIPLLFCHANKKILSVRGMLHTGALSQKKWKKRIFLQLFKTMGIGSKTVFHATDNTEEVFIKKEFGQQAKVFVAGNFPKTIKASIPVFKEVGYLNIVTVALISPMKNHLLVLEAIQHCTANIKYDIYGPIKDLEYWKLCLTKISILPKNISVVYHGEIAPANIDKALAESHVFIMPSKSENFGHAIYEAFSAGKPVITSNNTPWNELKESMAGINVDTTKESLTDAINFFSEMYNESYLQYANGAEVYADNKIDKEALTKTYQNMFFAQQ
jgi:glycosyltransferase involved in cell wall biosynthesis